MYAPPASLATGPEAASSTSALPSWIRHAFHRPCDPSGLSDHSGGLCQPQARPAWRNGQERTKPFCRLARIALPEVQGLWLERLHLMIDVWGKVVDEREV